ncbi:ATP-binding protein [Ancylobacter sp. 6x-1]|uniref:ATP-binding protein n=1 Tax=Ancylobacter crimeensis TaxID=2579147 RepID=A0ABT0D5Z1_9HYPH|nr:ATP-binding protein [Ancylobacter crimeensis]MCK0195359.1 ATP-binding protein [Ancylobacter crimeensis]
MDPLLLAALRERAGAEPPAALIRLADAFGLTPFETGVIRLAFAVEHEIDLTRLTAAVTPEDAAPGIPVWLFEAALGAAEAGAFSHAGSLRRWRILRAENRATLAATRFRLTEPVTDAMAGLVVLDEVLEPVLLPVPTPEAPEAAELEGMADGLGIMNLAADPPVLVAPWRLGLPRIATALAALGLRPFRIEPARLAARSEAILDLQRLVTRDCALHPLALIAETPADFHQQETLAAFLDGLPVPAVLAGDRAPSGLRRPTHRLATRGFPRQEAVARWKEALGPGAATKLNGSVERAAAQFDLDAPAIARAAISVREAVERASSTAEAGRLFWSAAARAAWPEPGALARIVEPRASFADLVVPEPLREDLMSLVRQVRHAATVFGDWGFDRLGGTRGHGMIALFAGPSGTGKTLAAEVVAEALALPMVVADFSQLQSKWVGETPKQVGRLFDELERGGAMLVVNEVDGLLGRRSPGAEANDRYANAETGYLLQRLEAFRGVAILTTNLKSAIDEAFLRRFRFVLDFPPPDHAERVELWRRAFPAAAPMDGLAVEDMARFALTGGAIRNVALNAAFLAAEDGEVIGRRHVAAALRSEFRKLERPVAELEIGGFA